MPAGVRLCQALPGCPELVWALPSRAEPCQAMPRLLSCAWLVWALPSRAGLLCQAVPGYTKLCQDVLSRAGSYQATFQTVPGCGRLNRAMTMCDKACGSYHTLPTVPCQARPCQAVPGAAVPGAGPQLCHGGLQLPLWLRPGPGVGLRCHPGQAPAQGTHGVTWPWGCPPSLPGGPAAAAAPCRDLRAGVTAIMTGSRRGAGEEPVLNNVQIGHDICAVSWGRGDPPPPAA